MLRSSFLITWRAVSVLCCAVAMTACSTSGGSLPQAAAPLAATAIPATSINAAGSRVDFARCLQGDGAAGCFTPANLHAESTTGSALVAPAAPSGLVVSANGSTVFLSWNAPGSGDPASSYVIEAGSAPGLANLANFNTGNNQTSFSSGGVGAGTYYVRIRAVNTGGTSGASNEATLVVGGGGGGGCAGPPSGLTLLSQSAGAISFSWRAPSTTPSSYVIEAGSSPGLSNLANFDTGNSLTSFSANGIGAGSYYVRVRSKSSCGVSSPSNEILIFVVGFTGDVQVSVSWDAPTDVDLHVIDPFGEEIFYGNPVSSSGGQLDVDSNPACAIDGRQIENVRWGSRAPGGTYAVRVDYWASCGVAATNYLVTVRNGVSTQTFSGRFTGDGDQGASGAGVLITSFSHASSITESPVLIRAPQLMTPSFEKLLRSAARR